MKAAMMAAGKDVLGSVILSHHSIEPSVGSARAAKRFLRTAWNSHLIWSLGSGAC